MTPRVVIESPWRATNGEARALNRKYALDALKDSLSRGESPYASHLLLTQVLDDNNPYERVRGIVAGLAWAEACDLVAVYEDRGISEGMREAIEHAKKIGKPVEYRRLEAK